MESGLDIGGLELTTPAFIYDEDAILGTLSNLASLRQSSGLKLLFSVKALPLCSVLDRMVGRVDGFSVSSGFECRLAREVLRDEGAIHITTPGLRGDEIEQIVDTCDYISFNSVSQWKRLKSAAVDRVRCGLRINPGLSFLADPRHDPCRKHSKLGAPLDEVKNLLACEPEGLRGISGIHFHTMFGATSFEPLGSTIARIEEALGPWISTLEWWNLGGGYLLQQPEAVATLARVAEGLRARCGIDVWFEPGNGVVGHAGYLVASAIDIFVSDGKKVVILDTSVSHLPEVFEYQRMLPIREAMSGGAFKYVVAGSSCLSGDVFGEYAFEHALDLGSRLTFEGVGAYTLVKASRFNGINLPSIYAYSARGGLEQKKRYGYEDYKNQWAVNGA